MGTPRCTDFIIQMCPTLGPAPTRQRFRTTNNMMNQVFGDVFYFLFFWRGVGGRGTVGSGGHSGDVEMG